MEFLPLKVNNDQVYAGFWKRLVAAIIDTLVFVPFLVIFHFTQGISLTSALITLIISSLLFSVYSIIFHYKFAATLGKIAVGIKITLPDGGKIGVKQALLRSSVDLLFAFLIVVAHIVALTKVNPDIYLNAGWMERNEYILLSFPAWHGAVSLASEGWIWCELLVLLCNKRKRALHDFIAGTIVIKQEYTQQATVSACAGNAALSPVSVHAHE
ncbi:RDD family protein [Agarivorans sp. TSD2052]|uniref:RDD family protein n=1 Tax=Agarivorans sp. TSD2052 TaxID=2937286 RepID=UPI00200CFE21|nr:RDD family protein [Agarivorans sp. TSD2052]UPW17014.1 RDD family protein [Agarivorans sp. TSD2052]